ncbi:MAG TPA: hypothetical protein VFP32_02105 [Candidatus Saccharimonadales bacterium]|nr:hypothetical protein [Candidatus Saccharimonadales bacterium]
MRDKDNGRTGVGAIIAIIILLCIIGFLIWWFGFRSNSNNNTGNNSSQSTQQTDQQKKSAIRNNWATFFSGQTPAARKIALLQNGQQYSQVINAQAQTPTAKATTATVSNVSLNGSNSATVTYTVNINNSPALKDQQGQAINVNGVWKVSDAAFCGLLQLSGNVPPNCPGANQQNQTGGSTQTQPQGQTPQTSNGQ